MAKGRMIVRSITSDDRIWNMSDKAIIAWLSCIPYVEMDGTLPRSPRELAAFFYKLKDADAKAIVLEWLSAKNDEDGPMVEDLGDRLFCRDFEKCNENLDFIRKRKEREMSGLSGHSGMSARREEKRREERKQQRLAPSPSDSTPVFLVFPCSGPLKEWHLTQAKVAEYQQTYPGIDVKSVSRQAWQWCVDNPTNRKTARGTPSFLGRWFSRVQDHGWSSSAPKAPPVQRLTKCQKKGCTIAPANETSRDGKTKLCSMCAAMENE